MDARERGECMRMILDGQKAGLEELYGDCFQAVFAYALSILRDWQRAEDAAQEVFLKAWLRADTYRFGNDPKTWLMGIAKNTALDALRGGKAEVSDADAADLLIQNASFDDTEDGVVSKLFWDRVLVQLGEADREIFVLRNLSDLTLAQISGLVGLPVYTVARRNAAAVKEIRQILKGSEWV